MANLKFLIAAALGGCCLSSHAFYAGMTPPPGVAGAAGALTFTPSAADTSFANGIRSKIAGSINVGGRSVPIGAAFRFAPNAARVAAAAAYAYPVAVLALGVGSLVYQWFEDNDLEVKDGVWKKRTSGQPVAGVCYTAPCYEYKWTDGTWVNSVAAAGAQCVAPMNAQWGQYWTFAYDSQIDSQTLRISQTSKTMSSGYPPGTVLYGTCGFSSRSASPAPPPETQYDVLTRQQFEDAMAPKAIPEGVPQTFPFPIPWPVEIPIINPTPEPVPKPSPVPVPVPQPLRVPQGEPQPVPKLDPANPAEPQTYKTPVIDIVPAPKVDDPWRVDVQPKDVITESPEPLPETAPVPVTPPAGETTTPTEKPPGLCDEYPDILACVKLDTPEAEALPEVPREVTVSPDSGWGGSGGSCPPPKHITVQGRDIPIPVDLICQYMSGIRPIVIAMAWLSAGFILVGARGGD